MKWLGDKIIRFLDIYRKYEGLWDTSNKNYMKRNAREHNLKSLINELIEAGVEIPSEETLRKKMKNLKDAYRNEVNKVKQSISSCPISAHANWINRFKTWCLTLTCLRPAQEARDY